MKLLISLTRRLVDSLVGYGKEIISYFEDSGIAELVTAKPFVKAKDSYTRMVQGYMKARKNAYTDQLFTLDVQRDAAYRILRTVLQGFLYSEVPAEVAAAQRLNVLFEQYGAEFLDASYVKETAQLSKFLLELKKPENVADAATLKLTGKVDKLVDAAKKFDDTYSLSVDDQVARAAFDSATEARRDFEAELHRLMVYVEAMMDAADPKWVALCQKVEAFNIKFEQNEAKTKPKDKGKTDKDKNDKDSGNKDSAPKA
jgi:hypothetical protein